MKSRSWGELSRCQRVGVIVMATFQLALLATALWDLMHRRPEEIRGDRRMWAGIVFINWIGPIAYFCIGRRAERLSSVSRSASRLYSFFADAIKP